MKYILILVIILLNSCTVKQYNIETSLMEEMRKSVKDGFGVELVIEDIIK